ncbi:MAG: M48 family metalloprotease [Planctomycetes bacterium]|nr:M48 family metalloprotease [Planctomycetota bacterium]
MFRVRSIPTYLALLLSLVVGAGCATDQSIRAQATDYHKELEPAVLTDGELRDYLQQLGQRVVASAKELHAQKFGPKSAFKDDSSWMFTNEQFHLVNSSTLNAFTTGGDHAYIYSQLMRECRTEDELAAVVAHEFGHVYARHVHKGSDRQYAVLGGAVLLGAAGYAAGGKEHGKEYAAYGAGLGMIAGNFLAMGFTRDDEAEADKLGFEFYTHAGWDPERFGGFFQQLIDKGFDKTPEAASDHPSLSSRVAAAKQRAAALPATAHEWRKPPIADDARFTALKARAEAVGKTMPNDQSLARAKLLLAAVPSCLVPQESQEQVEARATLEAAQAAEQGDAKQK